MIDLNSASHLSDRINHFVDSAIDSQTEEPRQYLGASIIGHACERHIQFYWRNLLAGQSPTFPARIRRVFDRGNTYETRARQWLKDAGFIFGFVPGVFPPNSFTDGKFSGHVDGVITGWKKKVECPIQLPVLWECKCLNNKSWKSMQKDGLRDFKSTTYWAQVHVYMHYLNLPACLFTSVNADTMELNHELIQYNAMEADIYIARSKRVIESEELLPRCTRDRSYLICKWCDYAGRCWDE